MSTKLASLLALPLLLATATSARASDAPPTARAAAPAEAPGVGSDPNIDRAFLLPTALTQPKGTLTYNNYELLAHGLTYGITDRVQVTATVLAPVITGMPLVGVAALKGQIVDAGAFHLALQGSLGVAHETGRYENDSAGAVGAGALASICLREDCASLASASLTYQGVFVSGGHDASHAVLYGGSLVLRVGDHVKLLGELDSAAGSSGGRFQNIDGLLVNYGVRFHGQSIAADVGFMKPVSKGISDDLIMGLPFVNVSYRWQ